DSLVIRSVLRKQLQEQGHVVIEAIDGEDALRASREEGPDVILLDVEMPKIDGHRVLAELRSHAATEHIPVVFLTGRVTTDDVVEGLRLGAHDYLRKPFEPAELLARVSAALRVKRLQDELRIRNSELEAASRTDALTGLPNRRHMQEQLTSAASAAVRHDHSIAVLMVDVDHFKSVNDRLGHAGGDHVLRRIALCLATACRAEDVAGRWGGEEFLVVSPATDIEGASALAERIRASAAAEMISIDGEEQLAVTVSVGVAVGSDDIDAIVRDADTALYEAKAAGRNQVVSAKVP
ncbi:MAG: two-component system, cell cycle response regulator, partial [Actinomycetota bacterium]|nr:two-component system, cell cycle response regulator [Actinomycetota bacterium]